MATISTATEGRSEPQDLYFAPSTAAAVHQMKWMGNQPFALSLCLATFHTPLWRDQPNGMQARLVIVTGARPQVSTLVQQAGIKEEFRDDLRVTSKEALKVTDQPGRPSTWNRTKGARQVDLQVAVLLALLLFPLISTDP